jgi:hypothetical protein
MPCAVRHPDAALQTLDLTRIEKIPDQRRTNEVLLRRIRDDGWRGAHGMTGDANRALRKLWRIN